MRCQKCTTENRETARFCAQCGTTLERCCASCGIALPADARFCDGCGTAVSAAVAASTTSVQPPPTPTLDPSHTPPRPGPEILRSRHAVDGERKQVTVLFADIQGSTSLIDGLDPEDAVRLMQPTLEAMMEAVHRFEGTVNRVQGDGIMALFGAPIAHEDHAVRACHAALAMQSAAAGDGNLPVRVGLNTGEVVVRAISNDLTVEYEADGPAVHLAARMEQMATPGETLITASTYRLAQGLVMVDALGDRPVKGMSSPVTVFALRGMRAGRTRMEARSGESLSPFVGRESELAALERALVRAGESRGQVIAISGETGVGKSRLVHELVERARGRGWTVRLTGADPLATTTSYAPVVHLLTSLFDIDDDDDSGQVGTKITGAVLALDPNLAFIVPALHAVFDIPVADDEWPDLSPEERRRRIIEAICALTLRRAEAMQLLMVFEDLHWVDAETQAVLDALVDGLGGTRMVLLTSYRPEYQESWGGKSYYTRLRVDPLEALTADEFLVRTLGHDPGLEQLKRLLVEQTQGVPFFLEESIRALLETGHIRGEAGAYRLTTEVAELEVPATVQVVLAARIDRLPPAQKEVLQIAAVIGRHVPLPLLASVAGTPPAELVDTLNALQKSEFLYLTSSAPEAVYAFKHALTQEVAYASLLHEVRRRVHARLVSVTEERHAARLDEHLALLGRHALDAELWEKADAYLGRAAERATERHAYHEVIRLLDQQLAALGRLPHGDAVVERMFDAHLMLRAAHGATGNVGKMIAHVQMARSIKHLVRDAMHAVQVEMVAASVVDLVEDIDAHLASMQEAGIAAKDAGNVTIEKLAGLCTGIYCTMAGRYEDASAATIAPLADGGGVHRHERFGMTGNWTLQMLAVNAINEAHLGRMPNARRAAKACAAVADETGRPFDTGIACWTLGAVGLWSGDLAGTVEALSRGYETCDRGSVAILMPNLAPTLAYALCLADRREEARDILLPWLEADESTPTFWFHCWGAAFTGLAGVAAGEADGALRAMRRWQELIRRHGLAGIGAEVERCLALCRVEAGGDTSAQVLDGLTRAMTLADSLGAAPEAAHCRLELGRHAQRQGDAAVAARWLGESVDRFSTLGMPRWEAQARQLLV